MPQLPCPRASLDVLKKKNPLAPARTQTPTCQAHALITIPTSRMWRIFFYEVQWYSFNQTSSNSEILIIMHLKVIPKLEVLFLPTKSFVSDTGSFQGPIQKGLQDWQTTSTIVASFDPLSHTRSASSALKTAKTWYIAPMALKQQMGISKSTPLISCTVHVWEQ
jgi:hypothetical protein